MRAPDSSCTRAPNQGHAASFFASCSYRWASARRCIYSKYLGAPAVRPHGRPAQRSTISFKIDLHWGNGIPSTTAPLHRGNGIARPRDKRSKLAFRPETVSAGDRTTCSQSPPIAGLWLVSAKSSGSKDCVVGPAGETRTSNQTVMSAPTRFRRQHPLPVPAAGMPDRIRRACHAEMVP